MHASKSGLAIGELRFVGVQTVVYSVMNDISDNIEYQLTSNYHLTRPRKISSISTVVRIRWRCPLTCKSYVYEIVTVYTTGASESASARLGIKMKMHRTSPDSTS